MTESLTEQLTRFPAQPLAAMRVLEIVEDRGSSAGDLARVIETDPSLSARVMRLANSPYYGLTRRVSSAAHAVVLLGFSTVRALAVGAAYGLLAEDGPLGPKGFWAHAVATAACASVVAGHAGLPAPDAFSAGLLHDIGAALLFRSDPIRYAGDVIAVGDDALEAERLAFGVDHARAGAEVLQAWRFPMSFVEAVAHHHEPPFSVRASLARTIIAGHPLAHQALGAAPSGAPAETVEVDAAVEEALDAAGVRQVPARRVMSQARFESRLLLDRLGAV